MVVSWKNKLWWTAALVAMIALLFAVAVAVRVTPRKEPAEAACQPTRPVAFAGRPIAQKEDAAEADKEAFKFMSGEEWQGASAVKDWAQRKRTELDATMTPEEYETSRAMQSERAAARARASMINGGGDASGSAPADAGAAAQPAPPAPQP